MAGKNTGAGAWIEDRALRLLIGGLLALPYGWRVPLCGWVMSRVIAPLAGYDRRVRDNLARILPDLPEAEVRRLMRKVPDNVGRTVIEIYSGQEFVARTASNPLHGAGVEPLAEAHVQGRPVVLVTGHFGNYDASRAALIARGYPVGALYRPMNNAYFNEHYVRAMESIGKPLFPRGKRGLAAML
ncbi:lauroyl acyltransferase, partial [Cereibacter changlensis JA139]